MNIYRNGKFAPMTVDEVKELERVASEFAQESNGELNTEDFETRVAQLEQAVANLTEENTALKLAQGLSTATTIKCINSVAKAVSEGG